MATSTTDAFTSKGMGGGSSGIKVIVVGLGVGGLAAAIECHRKGHTVVAFEMRETIPAEGDGLGIGTNAARVVSQWGDGSFHKTLLPLACSTKRVSLFDYRNQFLGDVDIHGYQLGEGYALSRKDMVMAMYEHAKSLGIDLRLNSKVTGYWESENEAGVEVNHGEKIAADCVVCSDGVHSTARDFICSKTTEKQDTGAAIFRACFPADAIAKNPRANWILEGTESADIWKVWLGDGIKFAVCTVKGGEKFVWSMTHKNSYRARETWSGANATMDDVIECIKHWPICEIIEPVLRETPSENLIDQSLVGRKPLDTWLSPQRRMILIGDAAHWFLPFTGQGANQAIEDAAVLAIALELAGKGNEPLALSVTEKIRYPRATLLQTSSSSIHNASFDIDWDAVAKNPAIVSPPRPNWVFGHDCQDYTYREFAKVVEAIKNGQEYVATNIAPDGTNPMGHDYCELMEGK